jgi:hypothetical protein
VSPANGAVEVVRSLAEASEEFMAIAAALRSLPGVRTVSHPCRMRTEERVAEEQYRVGRGEGFRVEWYAEADFTDGSSMSFCQELSWHEGEWIVDASVRGNDDQGERVLLELPSRHATDAADLVVELRSQTRLLRERQDDGVIRLFMQG